MVKRSLAIAAAIVSAWTAAAAAEVPAIDIPVNDRAGVLTPSDIEQLDGEIVRLRVETGAQLALLIVRTTGGVPIEDFALQVAEKWGGGAGKRSDGVLLVLALDDRRSRLDVGYDLEDRLPDARARRILDAMAPSLRAADHAAALLGAVGEIARALAGLEPAVAYQREPTRSAEPATESSGGVLHAVIALAVLVALVGLIVLFATSARWRRGGAFALEISLAICRGLASMQGSSSGWSSSSSSSSWGSRSSSGSTSSGSSSYSSPSWGGGGGKFGGGGASSSW